MTASALSHRIPATTKAASLAAIQQPQVIPMNEPKGAMKLHKSLAALPAMAKAREIKAEKMLDAWDKIGIMTSEMAKSIMSKEAVFVAERYRAGTSVRPLKKRRMETVCEEKKNEDERPAEASPCRDHSPEENWSASLSRRVDRMARMSKLVMEIEYCHRLLRKDMLEIQKELCS